MMWNLYIRVFIKSHLLHCKIFWQFRNQWIHFAVNGLKMRGYRCQTVNHNWPVYFFRLDIPKKRKRKPKPLSICGLTKQKTELHPTRLYQRSHIMSIIRPSPRQPFGLSIWGNGGPAAVVYKLPLIPCLVHSRPVVHASYRRSGLRLGHTRWTAAESDIRFCFFFPDGFYEICCSTLFSAAPLSSGAALMFGHHLSLFWLSLGSWWVSRGSEGGREECVRTTWAHTHGAGGNVFLSSQRGLW